MVTWASAILPYIEEGNLARMGSEKALWAAYYTTNAGAWRQFVTSYLCPSDTSHGRHGQYGVLPSAGGRAEPNPGLGFTQSNYVGCFTRGRRVSRCPAQSFRWRL